MQVPIRARVSSVRTLRVKARSGHSTPILRGRLAIGSIEEYTEGDMARPSKSRSIKVDTAQGARYGIAEVSLRGNHITPWFSALELKLRCNLADALTRVILLANFNIHYATIQVLHEEHRLCLLIIQSTLYIIILSWFFLLNSCFTNFLISYIFNIWLYMFSMNIQIYLTKRFQNLRKETILKFYIKSYLLNLNINKYKSYRLLLIMLIS